MVASYFPSRTTEKETQPLKEGAGKGRGVFQGLRHWKQGVSKMYSVNASRRVCWFCMGISPEGIREIISIKFLKDKPWYDFDLGVL